MDFNTNYHARFSWRAVGAGLLTSLLALMIFTGLGVAFGGGGLDQESTFRGALTFAGIWTLISVLVSIAIGSYVAARLSAFEMPRFGAMHGVVLAAFLLSIIMWQTFAAAGWVGRTAGNVVGSSASLMSQGTQAAAQNSTVIEIVEDALGDVNLTPDRVQAVATGVASRLLRGNTESARLYLSRQTGISSVEAEQRIAALRTRADEVMNQAREASSRAMISVGWTLFATSLLSAIVAIFAGALGSRHNAHEPHMTTTERRSSNLRPATV